MTRSIKASSSYLVDMYESHGLTIAKQGKSRTEFSTVILSQLWTQPKQLRSSSLAKTKKLYLGFPEWYEHNFDVFFKLRVGWHQLAVDELLAVGAVGLVVHVDRHQLSLSRLGVFLAKTLNKELA